MTPGEDELGALRRRAYGRQADIHLDSAALERLQELEGQRSPKPSVAVADPAETPAQEVIDEPSPIEPTTPEPEEPRRPNAWIRRLSALRRSTVLIALGVVAFVVVIVVVLTLVQRVQTDPLQVGAHQVARLAPDSAYEVPTIFGGSPGVGQAGDALGYQEFHGMRAVVSTTNAFQGTSARGVCLNVYVDANITDPKSNSFSGADFRGCSAGQFPAVVQFDLRTQEIPTELRSAFPPSTALQFVYDKAHDEVVVFSSR